MTLKALLICASALFVQSAFSQYAGGPAGPLGLAGPDGFNGFNGFGLAAGYGSGCSCGGVASTGGGLPVTSSSPVAPYGVSVKSDNCYEGVLCAGGKLPFLGSISLEGVLPTAGTGAISYGCGNGANGIIAEGPIGTGILAPGDYTPSSALNGGYGLGGIGYVAGYGIGGIGTPGYGIGGLGCDCGCGGIY